MGRTCEPEFTLQASPWLRIRPAGPTNYKPAQSIEKAKLSCRRHRHYRDEPPGRAD